ncbi:aldehyde dehydrogenase [Permianibacter sp. IMCC34836]|uniref:aldehyde dehydrogenase n=1 Tax=Permianibacter fluminis TaxID=2738515 RepID=UPI0015531C10|nr:aldehyde dehydrogenase [Permianibacter fluminis]NQD39080.1 aldehyde dehydrogenase [Permianibacter fluminis]
MTDILNYINGELLPAQSNDWLDNYEPATGEVYSRIADSDAADVELAVQAARAAFPAWKRTSVDERARLLSAIADKLEHWNEALAEAESMDNGKPVWLARTVDIPRAAHNFRFFAHAITQWPSESHAMPDVAINYTLRDPIGVVGCISPWNLPLYLFSWKIAPALAAGNCVVAKPSEVTPMTAFLLANICREVGLPAGVLNIVHGLGSKCGNAIVSHPQIKAISFTGGTKTGEHIARIAAPVFKKLSLELGGKNPTVVFADCDLDQTVNEVMRTAFSNQGQICLCGSRIYVERSIYDKFRDALTAKVKALKVGDPMDAGNQQGAIVSKLHFDKVLSYIELAKQEGGRLLTGGHTVKPEGRCQNGWFIAPTLFENLAPDCRTNQEEIFGPVATITPFDSEDEVVGYANGTAYGLAASVWTTDLKRAHRVAAALESGIVWVNCWLLRDLRTPFGGVKQSGVGREGGVEALRFFTEAKNVCIKL